MNGHSGLLMSALCASLLIAVPAAAKPVSTTKYTYYTIAGDTAAEIYNAMIRRGPHVNGEKAYAATSATSSQQGTLAQGKSCRIDNYQFKIDFVIKLPKIKNEAVLPPAVRSRWHQFQGFLKSHEETHRSIWLDCARDLEAKIRAISTKDCGTADARATKLWNEMRRSCNRRHEAFDAAEQQRLVRQPFVKLVFSRQALQSAGAKVTGKKKKKKTSN